MPETSPGDNPPSQPNLPPGAKKEDRPDFRVIRSAPPPDSGPSVMPLVLLVAVIALGVGGYMYSQKKPAEAGEGKGTTTATDGKSSSTTTTPPKQSEPAPEFVMERIGFYEQEGNLPRALEYAQEKLADYPGAPNLKAKITELRGKLGLDVLANPEDGLRQAEQRIKAGQNQEAVDTLNLLLGGELTDAQQARAFFLLANAHANLGNVEDARSALIAAAERGYDPKACQALEERLGP